MRRIASATPCTCTAPRNCLSSPSMSTPEAIASARSATASKVRDKLPDEIDRNAGADERGACRNGPKDALRPSVRGQTHAGHDNGEDRAFDEGEFVFETHGLDLWRRNGIKGRTGGRSAQPKEKADDPPSARGAGFWTGAGAGISSTRARGRGGSFGRAEEGKWMTFVVLTEAVSAKPRQALGR